MDNVLDIISEILEQYPDDFLNSVDTVSAARKLLARDDGHYPISPEGMSPVIWQDLMDMDSRTRAAMAATFLIFHLESNDEDERDRN